jgi:cytochrome c biogenesis protein CcmG/thiol:disulfide interchange protein DsbE
LNHNGDSMPSRSKFAFFLLLAVLLVGGCGDEDAADPESPAIDYEAALADAPPKLAAHYGQGDALVPGGQDAFEDRLAELKGYPVVANFWASWCIPCRDEFPEFQEAAAEYGTRVAFIGVNTQDDDPAAETFLEDFPLPYPSVTDPNEEVKQDVRLVGLPGTGFYDRDGELVHLKQGPYTSLDELTGDIERYAS